VSVSLTLFAITFTAHVVPWGRSAVGSSVIAVPGEPLTVKVLGVPVGHSRLNELVETVTDSLKVTTMFALTATLVAPFAGEVVLTDGAASAGPTKTGNSFEVHWDGLVT
jgi:hypothetical protein